MMGYKRIRHRLDREKLNMLREDYLPKSISFFKDKGEGL